MGRRWQKSEIRQIIEIIKQQLAGDYSKTLTKFSYSEKGAKYFLRLVDSPYYRGYAREIRLIEKILPFVSETIHGAKEWVEVIDLGPGDGKKAINVLSNLGRNLISYSAFDMSKSMLKLAADEQKAIAVFRKKYYLCDFTNIEKLQKFFCSIGTANNNVLVMLLGNTLANETDMEVFLAKFRGLFNRGVINKNFFLVGLEFYDGNDDVLIREYDNEINRQLTFLPLGKIGIDRGCGEVVVTFNVACKKIEEKFIFEKRFLLSVGTKIICFDCGDEILLSVTHKPTIEDIKMIFKNSGCHIRAMEIEGNYALIYASFD